MQEKRPLQPRRKNGRKVGKKGKRKGEKEEGRKGEGKAFPV